MSSPPWAGSICRGLSQGQKLMLVLGENLVKGQSCIFGVDVAVSCRALAEPAALSRALCWAKCKGPESLPLVGIFIPMATTVGRKTLIIHLCTLNFNRGKQTVLEISSPEVWTSALFSWEHGKVLENQVLFQSLNPQASQVQYLLCQTP